MTSVTAPPQIQTRVLPLPVYNLLQIVTQPVTPTPQLSSTLDTTNTAALSLHPRAHIRTIPVRFTGTILGATLSTARFPGESRRPKHLQSQPQRSPDQSTPRVLPVRSARRLCNIATSNKNSIRIGGGDDKKEIASSV